MAREGARKLAGWALGLLAAAACSANSSAPSGATGSTGGTGGSGAAGSGGAGGLDVDGGAGGGCACAPGVHGDVIFVLSDAAEVYAYDPKPNTFALIGSAACSGAAAPYSMAVDRAGRAWVLDIATQDLATLDVNAPAACQDPGFTPGQAGFGLFGMAYSADGPGEECSKLYMLSYSGSGPFAEGPGLGSLGVMDPSTLTVSAIGSIDFDGGELAGTSDGRLFAFAGTSPPKLVEYDKATAAVLGIVPLEGFSKTNASAFAFHRGDVYFFTEAPPAACAPCLDQSCAAAHQACLADPACADALACALAQGDINDACGGAMPAELTACLTGACLEECFPSSGKVSQVTRMDYDGSEGAGQTLTVVNAAAPIRIVGAGVSTCVPAVPR